MRNIIKKFNIVFSIALALFVGVLFCFPANNNDGGRVVLSQAEKLGAYVDGSTGSTAYLKLHSEYSKLTSNAFSGSLSTNSTFTIYISNTFTQTNDASSYSFALAAGLAENSTKFALGQDSQFTLLDFSNSRTGNVLYTKTLAASETEVQFSEFAQGGNVFTPSTVTAGQTNTEEFQFIVNLSMASVKPTAGTYYFIVYRTTGETKTAIGYKEITFNNQTTSFSFTTTTSHQTMLSDSTESITLNFVPSDSNSSGLNGTGTGVRLKVISPTNTTLPATTSFVLKYGGVQQGDTSTLEKTFAFDFTQSSMMTAEVMVPYQSGLADGAYTFAFDVFDKDLNIIATATATFSFINVNYKVRATTYIQHAQQEYSKSVVYTIGQSLSAICHIQESLPAGTTMQLKLEKRDANQTTYTLYATNLNLEITQMRTNFATVTSGDNSINLTEAFVYGTAIEAEMVLRFNIQVYDRNGTLQSTTNSYVAVVEDIN